jgi:L-aspartate oxidase
VASSGIHGANRLASNSLSECLVMARQLKDLTPISINAAANSNSDNNVESLDWQCDANSTITAQHASKKLQQLCWQVAGVERWGSSLREAEKQAKGLQNLLNLDAKLKTFLAQKPGQLYSVSAKQQEKFELLWDQRQRNLVSLLLLQAAAFRTESRGGHFRRDAPLPLPYWCRHSLQKRGDNLRTAAVGL